MKFLFQPIVILAWMLLLSLCACKKEERLFDTSEVKIYRDSFGVPHIYAPTDEKVAYGLAWAECEDDFVTIQEQMLVVKGTLKSCRFPASRVG